jgi:exopolysaccharide production protein ExoZ
VPLFFVISGLVMILSSAALPLEPSGAKVFMRRRLLRVVPLYWLATSIKVAFALLVPAVVLHNHFDLVFAIKSYLFVPSFNLEGEVRPIHGVGWTLLHEMFFYLAFAAAMALRVRPLWWVSALITALCFAGALWPPQSAGLTVVMHPVNLCFVVGMWVGWGLQRGARERAAVVACALFVVAAVAPALGGGGAESLLPSPAVIVVAISFLLLASWRMPRAAKWPIALGNSSYALYLFHPFFTPPILLLAHKLAPNSPVSLQIALAVLSVLVLSHLLHLWVEQPLVRRAQSLGR